MPAQAMKWKPIKTAPKDGTPVLLFMSYGFRLEVGYFQAGTDRFPDFWTDGEYSFTPTHWMPLPEPPDA